MRDNHLTDAHEQRCTWEEICARYPNEWVVLVDIDWIDEDGEFRTAIVLDHGPDCHGTLRRSNPVRAGFTECIHDFTGRLAGPVPRALFHDC